MTGRSPYAGFPVVDGEAVTQGHADYCQEFGHATWTVDGEIRATCPRCGETTDAVDHAAALSDDRQDLMMKAEGMARVTGSASSTYQDDRIGVATWNRPGASIPAPKYPKDFDKGHNVNRLAVNLSIQIDVDPESWTANYGIAGYKLIREDVAVYVDNLIREQLAASGVTVHGLSVTQGRASLRDGGMKR